VPIDQPEQVGLRNLILEAEGVEQRFLAGLLTHHRGRPPESTIVGDAESATSKSSFSTASFLSDSTQAGLLKINEHAAFRTCLRLGFLTSPSSGDGACERVKIPAGGMKP